MAGVTSHARVWCETLRVTLCIRLKELMEDVRLSIARVIVSKNFKIVENEDSLMEIRL